ncbi:MAG: hypothetical protein ACREFR_18845 [Limisphaerales bacterium]
MFLFFASCPVYSQNLVQNGNFDANGGSFVNWQISHTVPASNYSGPAIASPGFDGNPYYARFEFEPNGGQDVLSQDIATTAGALYDINFWAEDGAGHDFQADVSFGNFSADLLPAFSIGPGEWFNGWTNFNFEVTASELESDLAFAIAADTGSEFGLDDISVVQAPDFDGVVVGKTFHVTVASPAQLTVIQATTNFVNWVNVCTNTPPFTFTDSISQYPRRFYRAAVSVGQSNP